MSIFEHKLPGKMTYVKLSDMPDGEIFKIVGVSVRTDGKYGPQGYLRTVDDEMISLPTRYTDWARSVETDAEALIELREGIEVVKTSYEYDTGKFTPSIEFVTRTESE